MNKALPSSSISSTPAQSTTRAIEMQFQEQCLASLDPPYTSVEKLLMSEEGQKLRQDERDTKFEEVFGLRRLMRRMGLSHTHWPDPTDTDEEESEDISNSDSSYHPSQTSDGLGTSELRYGFDSRPSSGSDDDQVSDYNRSTRPAQPGSTAPNSSSSSSNNPNQLPTKLTGWRRNAYSEVKTENALPPPKPTGCKMCGRVNTGRTKFWCKPGVPLNTFTSDSDFTIDSEFRVKLETETLERLACTGCSNVYTVTQLHCSDCGAGLVFSVPDGDAQSSDHNQESLNQDTQHRHYFLVPPSLLAERSSPSSNTQSPSPVCSSHGGSWVTTNADTRSSRHEGACVCCQRRGRELLRLSDRLGRCYRSGAEGKCCQNGEGSIN